MPNTPFDLSGLRALSKQKGKSLKAAKADKAVTEVVAQARRDETIDVLRSLLPDPSAAVKKAVEALAEKEVVASNPAELAVKVAERLKLPETVREALTNKIREFEQQDRAPATPDTTLDDLPEIQNELERAKVVELATLSGVGDKATAALLARMPGIASMSDQRIATLVVEGALKKEEAKKIGLAAGLAQLVGDDTDVVKRLMTAKFSGLKNGLSSLTDILTVANEPLASAIAPDLAKKQPDVARAKAESLRIRVEERFPAEGIRARLSSAIPSNLQPSLQKVEGLLKKDPDILKPDYVDADALKPGQREALAEVRATINAYPGLGLDKIVQDAADAKVAQQKVSARQKLFHTFVANNSDVDLLNLDFTPGSDDMKKVSFAGIAKADQEAVLNVVKAQARVLSVGGSVRVASQLLVSGYSSAMQVAAADPEIVSSVSKLTKAEADIVVKTARDARLTVTNMVATLADELRWDRKKWGWSGRVHEDVTDGLKRLPGYEEMFGSQSFCDCAHCDSILSPAAYFVDLMRFVEENVTDKEFIGIKQSHALKLQNRRPDLWTLPLTCENTNGLIPTLQIINEILETAIARRADSSIDVTNRPAIESRVYDGILPSAQESFVTPFDLGAAAVDSYVSDFETNRAEVLSLLRPNASVTERNAAALKLPATAYDMITDVKSGWSYLQKLYRMSFARTGSVANAFDVQLILSGMGISRAEFGDIVGTAFVQGADTIRIRSEKRDAESVQNDIERVSGMTAGGLDRIHRFWRLKQTLNWDAASLDLAIARHGGALTDAAIGAFIDLDRLAVDYNLDLDEAMSLSGPIPVKAIGGEDASLMNRLFNEEVTGANATPFPAPAVRFVHPGLRDDASLPDPGPYASAFVSQRLRVALEIKDAELLDLILMLAPALGVDPSAASEQARGFPLDANCLVLLYRHAVLAKVLDFEIQELGLAVRIATGGDAIETPQHLTQLLDFVQSLKTSIYGLVEIGALLDIIEDPVDAGVFVDAAAMAEAVISEIALSERTLFAPTVFAYLDGVSEDQSRSIVKSNEALFERTDRDMLRLKASVGLSPTLTAPASGFPADIGESDLQTILNARNLRVILLEELASALETEVDNVAAIGTLVGVDFHAQPLITAASGEDPTALRDALSLMTRPIAALSQSVFTADRIGFLNANRSLFSVTDFAGAYSFETMAALSAYAQILTSGEDDFLHAEAVDTVLASHDAASGFAAVDTQALALAAGGEQSDIRVFEAASQLPNEAVMALDRLRRIVDFADARGLDADAVALVASSDPAAFTEAAESLKAALQLRLRDEESFKSTVEVHENALRGKRRNALTDYIIRDSEGRFDNRSDLYNYYLIDPDMEGCARTSRVVCAVGSMQTYVHRILLNMEQDRRLPGTHNHIHISPSRIPADEWEWRKNYRVWEANRKVFLWPENYMLPELRDNKTPQFEELEKTILAQDVNEQTVLDAYASYLKSFEEVASLRVAGAFHEYNFADSRDVLHVFGCSSDDPPAYYYWTIENLTYSKFRSDKRLSYSDRRKIDVSIGSRDVSPFFYNNRLHLFWMEKSTGPWNQVVDGENKFIGYRHTLTLKFSFLRLDGSWSAPQIINIAEHDGVGGDIREGGIVRDPLKTRITPGNPIYPQFADYRDIHTEYEEGYTLRSPAWQKVVPGIANGELYLAIGGKQIHYRVDMYVRKAYMVKSDRKRTLSVWTGACSALHMSNASRIYEQWLQKPNRFWAAPHWARRDFVVSEKNLTRNLYGWGLDFEYLDDYLGYLNMAPADLGSSIAVVHDPEVHLVVPGSTLSTPTVILQKGTDAIHLGYSFRADGRKYEARRLGTTVLTDMGRKLFYDGVGGLLDRKSQAEYGEKAHLLSSTNFRTHVAGPVGRLDYTGPLGVYFRELLLHIPTLLGSVQNMRGQFAAAQGWQQAVFDPTAEFANNVNLVGLSDEARLQAERDRVWQYAEFRGMTPPSLRDILTDEDAQESYRKDPFNPYAIARLRLSAFQKNMVMRYVGNLLDWADNLFRQFTRESVDEANVLYDLARQILGPRPADAGNCGEGGVRPRSYEKLRPHLDAGQDFLIEVETYVVNRVAKFGYLAQSAAGVSVASEYLRYDRADLAVSELKAKIESTVGAELRFDAQRHVGEANLIERKALGSTEKMLSDDKTIVNIKDAATAGAKKPEAEDHVMQAERFEVAYLTDGKPGRQLTWKKSDKIGQERSFGRTVGFADRNWRIWNRMRPDRFTYSLVRQISPAFCVPRNKDLLALWDRVEDRLFKIHNCRNIDGEQVQLALFAPEIDPMALVRAKAAGLSLSDIYGGMGGNLPPYRFSYLVNKARDYAGVVQSFGSKLLAAIEKRDGEELAQLRMTQAINMQSLVTKIRENEVKIAKENLSELQTRKSALEYRKSYLDGRIDQDLLSGERAEQILTHSAGASKILAALLNGTAGILHLIPQLGSPFAMKYGGKELGDSGERWGKVFSDTGEMLNILAKSAGLEAKYEVRRKEWAHQRRLENYEDDQNDRRIKAAEIRVEIAEKALENHKKSISDQEEVLDFYTTKFSGEALYSWMVSNLQGIYRQSFNAALSMARLAEQAYRFERPDDNTNLLELTYWEAGQAGLLAGDKLSIDLVAMEKRYVETNYRVLEITQPFSLSELDPAALMALRASGECNFTVPEFAFDLLYPGHYRRRIRSVRLSVACVTGPYVNIPAILTLTGAKLRAQPSQDGPAGLVDSHLRHTVQIATSTAQNDAGVFDFSFADARYMPFEGAGAVESSWKVTLPKSFRPFDYNTINDVVLHVSYTAQSDGVLRDHVETENAALEGALVQILSDRPLPRAYSLRQEFGTAFHQLATGTLGIDTQLSLDARALPFPLRGRDVNIDRALILVRPAEGVATTGLELRVNGETVSGFTPVPDFPGFVVAEAGAAFAAGLVGDHALAVLDAGALAPTSGAAGNFAENAVEDIVLYFDVLLD